MLAKAFDASARFTTAEIALIQPIATAIVEHRPASLQVIRQTVGALSASLPAQASDGASGALKLNAYETMLAGCDARALNYAYMRCLAELDWMPTIHQLLERIASWRSPECGYIAQAKTILRMGRRVDEAADNTPVTLDEMRAIRQRAEAAGKSFTRQRPQAVPFDTPELEPHQMRIPNRDDYAALGFDIDVERAKAEAYEAAQRAASAAFHAGIYGQPIVDEVAA